MKKNIYILGMICLLVVFLATAFKILHLPGAGILLLAGIGSAAIIFLPTAYFSLRKSTEDRLLKFLYTAALISFSVDFIGMLFKIMHWPGAGIFLMIGIPLPFILFLPAYIYYHIKRELKTDLNFFAVLVFMIYLGVFSSLLTIDTNYSNYMVYAHTTSDISKSNNFLRIATYEENPSEISVSVNQLVKKIDEIQGDLIYHVSGGKPLNVEPIGTINYFEVENKGTMVNPYLLSISKLNEFNIEFEKFAQKLIEKNPDSNVKRLIDEINAYRLPKSKGSVPVIAQLPMISAVDVLTDWQNKLMLISYLQGLKSI